MHELPEGGYETPTLVTLGSVVELTRGNLDGDQLDQDFPAGTPKSQLRFS